MYLLHLLLSAIVVLQLPSLIFAQDVVEGSDRCTFSCPETDSLSWPLVKRLHSIGFHTYYSIFECVYAVPNVNTPRSEHKCSYNKGSGSQALGAVGDNCPPQAIPCPEPSSTEGEGGAAKPPLFSNLEKEEIPPWIEGGRFMLYLQEHHG